MVKSQLADAVAIVRMILEVQLDVGFSDGRKIMNCTCFLLVLEIGNW